MSFVRYGCQKDVLSMYYMNASGSVRKRQTKIVKLSIFSPSIFFANTSSFSVVIVSVTSSSSSTSRSAYDVRRFPLIVKKSNRYTENNINELFDGVFLPYFVRNQYVMLWYRVKVLLNLYAICLDNVYLSNEVQKYGNEKVFHSCLCINMVLMCNQTF